MQAYTSWAQLAAHPMSQVQRKHVTCMHAFTLRPAQAFKEFATLPDV